MDIRSYSLPGGIGISHMRVYTTPGPDGVNSGAPHFHLLSGDIYYALTGSGLLELIDINGPQTIELHPGVVAFMRPGVIHRLVNPLGNLEVLSIMQNGGMAERGDFFLTFPLEIMEQPGQYNQAVKVPDMASAHTRRDLSVRGFLELKAAFHHDPESGKAHLRRMYKAAMKLASTKVEAFEWSLKHGAGAEAKSCLEACHFIRAGEVSYLEKNIGSVSPCNDPNGRPGMGGVLRTYTVPANMLRDVEE